MLRFKASAHINLKAKVQFKACNLASLLTHRIVSVKLINREKSQQNCIDHVFDEIFFKIFDSYVNFCFEREKNKTNQ